MLPPKLFRVFLLWRHPFFVFFVAFSLSSFVFTDITVIDILLPCLFYIIFFVVCVIHISSLQQILLIRIYRLTVMDHFPHSL